MSEQQLSFEHWRKQVDACLVKRVHLIGDDLPDVDYRGLYASGDSPEEAANYVIENAVVFHGYPNPEG